MGYGCVCVCVLYKKVLIGGVPAKQVVSPLEIRTLIVR